MDIHDLEKLKAIEKKKVLITINKERYNVINKFIEKEKIAFSELIDYLLKQFYNQFKDKIDPKPKKKK